MKNASAPESTLVRELLFGLAGGGIAIGCLLPPLLHFGKSEESTSQVLPDTASASEP